MNGFSIENIILIISMCIICSLCIRISNLETTLNKIIDEIHIIKEDINKSINDRPLEKKNLEEEERRKKIKELFDRTRGSV